MMAAAGGHITVIRNLLSLGGNVNFQNQVFCRTLQAISVTHTHPQGRASAISEGFFRKGGVCVCVAGAGVVVTDL